MYWKKRGRTPYGKNYLPKKPAVGEQFWGRKRKPPYRKEAEEGFTARDVGSQNRAEEIGILKGSQPAVAANPC